VALWDRFRKPRIAAVFHEDYVTGYDPVGPDGIFDPLRPARIRAALLKSPRRRLIHWISPPYADTVDLERVHPPAYLDTAATPAFIAEVFGLHHILPWETELWDGLRRAVGGTVAAVDYALAGKLPVFNLTGGFHHAHPQRASGFCILNDVAVALAAARARGFGGKVAVVDLDYHHGDGNEECLKNDSDTWLLSLHAAEWSDAEKGEAIRLQIGTELDDAGYLAEIRRGLRELETKITPQLVIYVAGTDPWEKDKMCNMRITEAGMLRRDLEVAAWASGRGASLVVVPAGGYGIETWRLTANFAASLLEGAIP
jgi:acetoin utilization deacetylase AcuC-like enzyme